VKGPVGVKGPGPRQAVEVVPGPQHLPDRQGAAGVLYRLVHHLGPGNQDFGPLPGPQKFQQPQGKKKNPATIAVTGFSLELLPRFELGTSSLPTEVLDFL